MHPRSLRIAAVIVAVLTAGSAAGVYYTYAHATTTCTLSTSSAIVVDQPEKPDSLDPAIVYTTPGWAIVQQTYQTLVMYNGSAYAPTTANPNYMAPLLAKNWTESADGVHWNFTLFPDEYFSNGDPLNAYVLWYSMYRGMVMNQPLVYLLEENFYLPGQNYNNTTDDPSSVANTTAWLQNILNEFTTPGFVENPPADVLSVMEADNQSFRVINATTIQFNIGAGYIDVNGPSPYPFLLDQVATPGYAAVDPVVVSAHGGVVANSPNSWMANDMLGSGPYNLTYWSPTTGYVLTPNHNYWAQSLAASLPHDNNIQPAKSTIDVSFQENPTIVVENMETGAAALGSFAYIGPSLLSSLSSDKCLDIDALPTVYGSVSFSGWIYMDQQPAIPGEPANPFTNLSVRAAVVHAIDYASIIKNAFGGNASQWVGPVPPGYPDYNPTNLPNYTYDPSLAMQEMNNSPYPMSKGGLDSLFPNGITFEYLNTGDWETVANLLKVDLAAIDIPLNIVGMSIDQLVEEQADNSAGQCISATSSNGGPFYIGMDYYTADYVGPDDATQLNALSYGGYNICMSEYANSTVDNWIFQAAESLNPTTTSTIYGEITSTMYYNYTDAWLVVPTSFQVYNSALGGSVANPMGSAINYQMEYNLNTV